MAIDPTGLVDKVISWLPANCQQEAREGRKAVVSGIGALLTALTLLTKFAAFVPEKYRKSLSVAISILTAAAVWLTPNDPPAAA